MTVSTLAAALAKRATLINTIWGGSSRVALPVTRYSCADAGGPANFALTTFWAPPATDCGWLVTMSEGQGTGPSARAKIHSKMLYAQFPGATKLMIVHAGHHQGFTWPRPTDAGYQGGTNGDFEWQPPGMRWLLKRAATNGCDLLMPSMVLMGENRIYCNRPGENVGLTVAGPQTPNGNPHEFFPIRPDLWPTTGHWLKYFLDPVLSGLDWMLAARSYDRIGITGVSGGGWTSTVAAALDPRIERSYPVSGSVPLAYRREIIRPGYVGREGDAEQYEPALVGAADYDDLYMMSVAETGRKSHLFYSLSDPLCFSGEAVARFGPSLEKQAKANGFGDLRFRVLPGDTHDFQTSMVDAILNDFLS